MNVTVVRPKSDPARLYLAGATILTVLLGLTTLRFMQAFPLLLIPIAVSVVMLKVSDTTGFRFKTRRVRTRRSLTIPETLSLMANVIVLCSLMTWAAVMVVR